MVARCSVRTAAVNPRPIAAHYIDPLTHIWLSAAQQLGLQVERGEDGYATTDGRGRLRIARQSELDADDCLAQIILHELCHALVQGEDSFASPDWGLRNDAEPHGQQADLCREHACLRVQAALLRPYGLRRLLGPTTDFRAYYDALPMDPLLGAQDDPSRVLAAQGLARAGRTPFRRVLFVALAATAEVHRALGASGQPSYDAARAQGQVADTSLPPLWSLCPAPKLHRSGLPMSDGIHRPAAAQHCERCVYALAPVRGRGPWRCQQSGGPDTQPRPIEPHESACALFREALDCQDCGACCRHAYDLVPVAKREPVVAKHPGLIEQQGKLYYIRRNREAKRCLALGGPEAGPFACQIYVDRPNTCREFAMGSFSCVTARRTIGLEVGSAQ